MVTYINTELYNNYFRYKKETDMNWFTNASVSSLSDEAKASKVVELDDLCEHVEADSKKLYRISREHDSMGSESYGMCEECWNKAEEYEDNQEDTCHDCHGVFKMKELKEWKWYDFYAPQGDEPLLICESCQQAEKHVERVRKDKADYDAEFPPQDDFDEEE